MSTWFELTEARISDDGDSIEGLVTVDDYGSMYAFIKISTLKQLLKTIETCRFKKPSLEEIKSYCIERKNLANVNPQKFFDHYESNGWRVGRNPMKDWKAAVRTWEKQSFSYDVKPQNTIRPQPSRCDMFKLPEAESPEAVTAAANNAREMFRALTNKTRMEV
jgi:hypothetical protein